MTPFPRRRGRKPSRLIWAWAIGTALFARTMMFFGMSYFCQMVLAWYLPLGMIGSLQTAVAVRQWARKRDAPVEANELGSPAPGSG